MKPKQPIKIIPANSARSAEAVDKITDVQIAINNALNVLSREINKLRIKSHTSEIPLSEKEMKTLDNAVRTLIAREKQQLEAAKVAELTARIGEMSDEELKAEMLKLMNTETPPNEITNEN